MSVFWGASCDDFYVSNRLFLKLDLSLNRETVLHFFDVMRKEFPGMTRLRRRDDGAVMLEEESAERGSRRWIRIEPTVLRFGFFAPPSMEEVERLSASVDDQATRLSIARSVVRLRDSLREDYPDVSIYILGLKIYSI